VAIGITNAAVDWSRDEREEGYKRRFWNSATQTKAKGVLTVARRKYEAKLKGKGIQRERRTREAKGDDHHHQLPQVTTSSVTTSSSKLHALPRPNQPVLNFCNLMATLPIKLWCHIEGYRNLFSVFISPDDTIEDVKRQIYNQEVSFFTERGLTTAWHLTLTKVHYTMIPILHQEMYLFLVMT